MSRKAGKIWREHGALEYRECAIDDENMKFGFPFPSLPNVKKGETFIFAWITYKSRAQRDRVNAKVMKDPRLLGLQTPMFDSKRISYGGFKVIVDV